MCWRLLPIVLLIGSTPSFAAGFRALGLPGSQLAALSDDGRSAAGSLIGSASGGFRWRAGEAPRLLPGAVSARAISPSGRYVVGSSLDGDQREVAAYWDASNTRRLLGGLPGVTFGPVLSVGYGITDTEEVVGTAFAASRHAVAFHWSRAGGMRLLDRREHAGGALGISGDGRRAYGWTQSPGALRQGAVWRLDRAIEPETGDVGAGASELTGANRALTILLGQVGARHERPHSYRWQPDRHVVSPGPACGLVPCPVKLLGSSEDGQVAVGTAGSGSESMAIVWTTAGGLQPLRSFLSDRSIDVPVGWTLNAATAVSSDGRHLGGYGLRDGRFDSFVAELPARPSIPAVPTPSIGAR